MGLFEDLGKEYLRHRLYRGRHRRYPGSWWGSSGSYWGTPRQAYMMRRHRATGPFGSYRRPGGVEVRGCGCCLPIPLGLMAGVGVAARLGHLARTG